MHGCHVAEVLLGVQEIVVVAVKTRRTDNG